MRRYLNIGPVLIGLLLATAADADCPVGQEPFTSCQIAGRDSEVFVCFDGAVASYSYGPVGGPPELTLSEAIDTVDFRPWPGLGKAIHETVTFYNDGYSYEVGGGFDRPFSDEEMLQGNRHFGWLEIAQDGQRLARLDCVPDTVSYGFGEGIYDAKRAAGLLWHEASETWVPDPDHPSASSRPAPILTQDNCLPAAEFVLGGIAMGDRAAAVRQTLGSARSTQTGTEGSQRVQQSTYDGLTVITLDDRIADIAATSPQWQTPSGLRVGLTRSEVIGILGRVPDEAGETPQVMVLPLCPDGQEVYKDYFLEIEFAPNKRIGRISLGVPWP